MRTIKNLFFLLAGLSFILAACEKVEDLPYYGNGAAVSLTASKTAVTPTPADSTSEVIAFSWSDPKYANDSTTTKYLVEIDSTGRNFSKKTVKEVIGNRTTSFTGREINAILLNYGFQLGAPKEMDVRVVSSYGNNNEQYISNVMKISFTPYNDPSTLTSTTNNIVLSLPNAAANALTFSWSQAFKGYTGNINYVLQYDSTGKNFANVKDIAVGNNLLLKALTQGELNETALQSGVPGGNVGKIDYRVKATTQQGAISYSNTYSVTITSYVPVLRFYMPGGYQAATGNGNDWDPGTAPELIRDMRSAVFNQMYYIYIYLPANAEFKFTQGRSWDVNYGGSNGDLSAGAGNLKVSVAGVYRISINRATMKYDIRSGRMGFVGDGVGAGWNPGNAVNNYPLGHAATNLFVGVTDFTVNEWKLIDSSDWNSGSMLVNETRSYGTKTGNPVQVNGDNFPAPPSAGRYRVIWDGRDVNQLKYEMSPATEMRLVGDGIDEVGVGDWSPGTSPQMTYSGNGVWTITVKLKAGKDIKFLAGNDWGAFDYEDNSGQSQAVGTARKIKWEGGNNFKTPATAGTYTITLNEKTQTVIIN